MARKSELIRCAEAKIIQLQQQERKLQDAVVRVRAEIKAYREMMEWSNNIGKSTKEKE